MRDDLDNLGGSFSLLLPIQPDFHRSNNLLPFTHLWSLALLAIQTITKPDSMLQKHRYHFANKGPYSETYGFSSSNVQMWELDHKKGWELKNWCFWIVVLEKNLESPLDCKKIKPVNSKGNQPWIFIGRTDAEAEASILWPPKAKSQFIGKEPNAGKDWWQEEKGMAKSERVGWHHGLNGREFEQTPGDAKGQGSLAHCSPLGLKELDTTWWLNSNKQQNTKIKWRV